MGVRVAVLVWAACMAAAPKLGEPAPEVELLDQEAHSLAELRGGRVVVLDEGGRSCGLEAAKEGLKRRGVKLVRARLPEPGGFWLVDENGRLRAAEPAPETAERIIAFLEEWESGKRLFEGSCATCHGEDGRDTTQYGVKSLGGVGNRMSREALRGTLNATMIAPGRYSIRCFHYTERELNALVTYVSGL